MTTRFEYALLYFLKYCAIMEYDNIFNAYFVDKYYDYEYDYKEYRGRNALEEFFNAN